MLTSAKLRWPWYQKVYFLKLYMCVLKFQVCSIILMSFIVRGVGGGANFTPSPFPPQNRPPKNFTQIKVNAIWHLFLARRGNLEIVVSLLIQRQLRFLQLNLLFQLLSGFMTDPSLNYFFQLFLDVDKTDDEECFLCFLILDFFLLRE